MGTHYQKRGGTEQDFAAANDYCSHRQPNVWRLRWQEYDWCMGAYGWVAQK